ncbi:hypothetical protein NLG97_g8939 [Lecanicillium saksenae]|uniref:Uncharacterized protein n=1 Tax=Lecanicillium saksenae TaxID=468837 RepID=A0ACC1QKF5_9HYPO|nr:hypothetical protein NLG97_g8939 [Lecanicillium saksenae]
MDHPARELDELDVFLYNGCDMSVEILLKYKRNGFHPILLGDTLPKRGTCAETPEKEPRYRILLKLGNGAFATAWLARDLVNAREAAILSKIHSTKRGTAGRSCVIELFDMFTIEGPNGFHECFVTEVVAPLMREPDLLSRCSWNTAHQILEGFAFLHGEGIAQGDPHLGNFVITLPQLDQFDEDDVTEFFASPEIIPVIPRDATFWSDSLPHDVTLSISVACFLKSKDALPTSQNMQIKIFDFGRAHETKEKLESLPGAVPLMVRAPEVFIHERLDGALGSAWSRAADLWAIGCIIYKILTGSDLVDTGGSLRDCYRRAIELGGPPPTIWPDIEQAENRETSEDHPQILSTREEAWVSRESRIRQSFLPFLGKKDLLPDLVKKLVVTDPEQRSSAAALLDHPYFQGCPLT